MWIWYGSDSLSNSYLRTSWDSCFLKFLKFNNNSPLDTYQFGIRASIQMAQKRNEVRVDCLEKEVGEIREEMQRLPGMEKTVMDLAQNVM